MMIRREPLPKKLFFIINISLTHCSKTLTKNYINLCGLAKELNADLFCFHSFFLVFGKNELTFAFAPFVDTSLDKLQ